MHFLDALEAVVETVAQHADALVFGRHFLLGDAEGFAHADDLMRRQGAGAHATLVAAAVHLRLRRTRGLRRTYSAPMPLGP